MRRFIARTTKTDHESQRPNPPETGRDLGQNNMPITPFHFGLGASLKAIGGKHFSFLIFCGSQVLMDIETGIRILVRSQQLHAFSNTYLGAVFIGGIAALIGKPITNAFLRLFAPKQAPVTWVASVSAAFMGTISHVILDSIMHPDAEPWAPFFAGNELLGIIRLDYLHLGCVLLGVIGGVVVVLRLKT